MPVSVATWPGAIGWPSRRLREGYRWRDLPSLAAARLHGLSPEAWEAHLNARETAAQVEVMRSTPRTLFLEITGRCPIECLMCARRYRTWTYGDLNESTFERLARVLPRVGLVVLGGFGEPLVARSFDRYFDRLCARRARVALQTSGYRLTEERAEQFVSRGLRLLHISIDSPDPDTYRTIRPRISFTDVQQRVRQIVQLKHQAAAQSPAVHIVFVAMRRNIEQLPAMVDLASDLGVDQLTVQYLVVHSEHLRQESLFYHQDLANSMLDLAQARAEDRGLTLDLPGRFGRPQPAPDLHCRDPWQVMFVRWNGDVRPCCYAPNALMGRLSEASFWSIWNGPAYRELRRRANTQDPPEYCLACTAGRTRGVDDEAAHLGLPPETERRGSAPRDPAEAPR
jgi:MoaA/NifB/PqqE/SkfB family radical SAM enzyme